MSNPPITMKLGSVPEDSPVYDQTPDMVVQIHLKEEDGELRFGLNLEAGQALINPHVMEVLAGVLNLAMIRLMTSIGTTLPLEQLAEDDPDLKHMNLEQLQARWEAGAVGAMARMVVDMLIAEKYIEHCDEALAVAAKAIVQAGSRNVGLVEIPASMAKSFMADMRKKYGPPQR